MDTPEVDDSFKILAAEPQMRTTFEMRSRTALRDVCRHYFSHEDTPYVLGEAEDRTTRFLPVGDATLLPFEGSDDIVSLARKCVLYSGTTILLHHSSIIDREVETIPNGTVHLPEHAPGLAEILSLNHSLADLVAPGRCVVLPEKLIHDHTVWASGEGTKRSFAARRVVPANADTYLPITRNPVWPDTKDYFTYKNLILPYFPEASLQDIARIASEESDAFTRFNAFLRRKLKEVAAAESRYTVEDVIEEIESEVAAIRVEVSRIQTSKSLRNITVAALPISLGVATTLTGTAASTVAGIVGSANLLAVLREYVSVRKERANLKKSEFYVPYLISSSS